MSDRDADPAGDGDDNASGGTKADTDEVGISDDQLPEDLQPTDDNPLAKPPSDDEDDDDKGISLGPDGPQA